MFAGLLDIRAAVTGESIRSRLFALGYPNKVCFRLVTLICQLVTGGAQASTLSLLATEPITVVGQMVEGVNQTWQ